MQKHGKKKTITCISKFQKKEGKLEIQLKK